MPRYKRSFQPAQIEDITLTQGLRRIQVTVPTAGEVTSYPRAKNPDREVLWEQCTPAGRVQLVRYRETGDRCLTIFQGARTMHVTLTPGIVTDLIRALVKSAPRAEEEEEQCSVHRNLPEIQCLLAQRTELVEKCRDCTLAPRCASYRAYLARAAF